MNSNLQNYKQNGFNNIEGWCCDELFTTIDFFDSLPINKKGGIAEIGVHHGKLFTLLNSIVEPNFNSYAIDIFDNQTLNIDRSGNGNLQIFKNNLEKYDVHKGKNTIIISGDSTDTALQLTKTIQPGSLRFISIDGGHTAEHAFNDLKIAEQLISNEGIVIVDDILNHRWLGVYEGVIKYLQTNPTLVPIMMGHNKLYMAKMSYKDYYLGNCQNINLPGKCNLDFWGFNILSYFYWPQLGW